MPTFIDQDKIQVDSITNTAGTGTPNFPNGIPATTINGNTASTPVVAGSGKVGEVITVNVSGLTNYTGIANQYGNVFVINKAALGNKTGVFMIYGELNVIANGAGGFSYDYISISDFSNNDTTDDVFVVNRWDPSNGIGRIMGFPIVVTDTSTKYIKIRTTFSSGTPAYRYSFRFLRIA